MSRFQIDNVSKAFFGVPALRGVTLELEGGRVLGLVGQNGAGKSTLMNIMGGVLQADSGSMTFADEAYAPQSPSQASARGIAFIHQELNLFTNLTVAENIFMGSFPRHRLGPLSFIDRRVMRQRSGELLRSLGLSFAPETKVDDLAPGERQLVEIVRALQSEARVVIFDEPTTSLTARETERLFGTIRKLREVGTSMVYISHILGDVLDLADDVAVLRDGSLVGYGPAEDFDVPKMISLMIGRDLAQLYPSREAPEVGSPILEVRGVSQPGVVKDISMTVRRREVVGLFGLMGSGRTEFARILFGLDPFESGEVRLDAKPLTGGPRERIRRGLAFVTEDRREEGLMMEASIAANLAIVAMPAYTRPPFGAVADGELAQRMGEMVGVLDIKSGDIATQLVKSLSGGNQQKVVLGKWLMSNPQLFILDEPTRGVDVGAKYEIYGLMRKLAAAGNGVLFISSELDELLGVCDRILVMSHGVLAGEFAPDVDPAAVLHAAFGEVADLAEATA